MALLKKEASFTQEMRSFRQRQKKLLLRRFSSSSLFVTGAVIFFLLLVLAFIGPLVIPYGPVEMEVANRLQAPSMSHLLGTDEFGRDLLSRIAHGAQVSLWVGLAVTVVTSFLGLVIGLYSSYYRVLDHVLMRISDGLMSIPGVLLAIALMAALGPSTTNVIIALSIVFTPNIARVVRSSALVIKEQTYIEAMHAQGASSFRIIWKHIAPNTISPLIVQATFIFAETIITEAALSFLGVGIPAPDPSWGNILYDGKLLVFQAWWMVVFPGIMIVLSVLGLNLLGDGLRDVIDPHATKGKK